MKFKILATIFVLAFFLQGYEYKYNAPTLDATNNAANRNNKGIMYMEMGHYNAAMTEFKVAISLNPNSPASAAYYNNLALLYTKMNKFEEANECIEKAISLNPVFLEYYKTQVAIYNKSDMLNKQIDKYLNQIEVDNNNSYAYLMLGLLYSEKSQTSNAIKYLKMYMAIEKNNIMRQGVKQEIKRLSRK